MLFQQIIHQYIKWIIIYHDKESFIPGMQRLSNIWKLIIVIHHAAKLKKIKATWSSQMNRKGNLQNPTSDPP